MVGPERRRLGTALVVVAGLLMVGGIVLVFVRELPAVGMRGRASILPPIAVAAGAVLMDLGRRMEAGQPPGLGRWSRLILAGAAVLVGLRLLG